MTHRDETMLLFRSTMRVTDGHLEDFREAIARAVDFPQQHGPRLMVQTFVDEERMLARGFRLYRTPTRSGCTGDSRTRSSRRS
ncbi:MAG TPA: hypothetical protein VHJ17_25045 [Thermomonospora sp.]|nr:hypothetical protein [Thermomonospora sp.]